MIPPLTTEISKLGLEGSKNYVVCQTHKKTCPWTVADLPRATPLNRSIKRSKCSNQKLDAVFSDNQRESVSHEPPEVLMMKFRLIFLNPQCAMKLVRQNATLTDIISKVGGTLIATRLMTKILSECQWF